MVYNSRDRSAAAWIHEQLAHRGLNVWVDYDHIFGGDALGSVIVDGMKASKTVIVLFSPEGLGSWGDEELRTIQNLYLSKQITKVIPVLLPGVAELPDILAVAGHRYVRFSDSLDDEPAVFNELERSITGREARASRRYFEIHVEVPFPGEGCFVASPAEPGDVRYDAIVRAIQSTGMAVLHNRDGSLPNFYADVSQGVRAAEVVVVDYGAISGQCVPAPEVVYELGLANALGKPTLVLTNGQCRLPTVVTVRRLLEYGDEELASGAFETRLAEAIKTVAGGLCYPFLTEVDLDDIYAIPNRLATLRFAVWRRLRNVLLFGIRLHDCFRDVSKHAHKLERDIQRVVHDRSDLRQMANCELHQRNWRVFEATFSQDYLRAHHTVEETYAELRSSGSSDVEQSFVFLASVLVGPLRELIDDSRGYYELAMNTLRAYFDIHDGLVPRMAGPGAPNNERAPLLSALCGELSRQAHLVNTQVSEMMTTLLELIAKDQEIGGAKHAHTRGHSHGNKADEHGAGSTPSAARSS
jgi:hypothetical protein